MPNPNGFRPYEHGYLRCTECCEWRGKDEAVEVDAQGSLLCPVCHRRLRRKRHRSLKGAGS